LALACDNDFV